MWAQLMVVAILATRVVWGREKCSCSQLLHPQKRLCELDFAYRVIMVHGEYSHQPGETDTEGKFPSYWKYTAEVMEVFKGEEYLWADNYTGLFTEIYTPAAGFCGRLMLYDAEKVSRQYLVAGTVELSRYNTSYKAITSCTWVEPWRNVNKEQRAGLRGDYSQCNCTLFPASAEKFNDRPPRRRFSTHECVYNPVSATNLEVEDCETLYGYCDKDDYGNGCHWRSTSAYLDCYHIRRSRLASYAKPALSTKQDCQLYTGRKKKMCIIKFVKSRVRQKLSKRKS